MTSLSIAALRECTGTTPVQAAVIAQLQSRSTRVAKTGKPYLEMAFADSTGKMSFKLWSDSSVYQEAESLKESVVLRLEARWTQSSYGMDAKDLEFHVPDEAALNDFYAGDPDLRRRQEADFVVIQSFCASIAEPRLNALCRMFLDQMGDRFRRTAAARKNHHARRGGLVEHVAQMMRSADAICGVYPELNRDLMLAGVLFHDCGKLWENTYPEHGFTQTFTLAGEMMGHIPLGIEMVNKLWRDLMESESAKAWADLKPGSDDTRLHLLHLIGSHHGEHQFGSPVLPRTPEAFALHYIDNLDAKLEMIREAYAQSQEIAPNIVERVFPLQNNLVRPLPSFVVSIEDASSTQTPSEPN